MLPCTPRFKTSLKWQFNFRTVCLTTICVCMAVVRAYIDISGCIILIVDSFFTEAVKTSIQIIAYRNKTSTPSLIHNRYSIYRTASWRHLQSTRVLCVYLLKTRTRTIQVHWLYLPEAVHCSIFFLYLKYFYITYGVFVWGFPQPRFLLYDVMKGNTVIYFLGM